MSKEIEIMPNTWSNALPLLLLVLENGSEDGRNFARAELERMAKLADRSIPSCE